MGIDRTCYNYGEIKNLKNQPFTLLHGIHILLYIIGGEADNYGREHTACSYIPRRSKEGCKGISVAGEMMPKSSDGIISPRLRPLPFLESSSTFHSVFRRIFPSKKKGKRLVLLYYLLFGIM